MRLPRFKRYKGGGGDIRGAVDLAHRKREAVGSLMKLTRIQADKGATNAVCKIQPRNVGRNVGVGMYGGHGRDTN